MIVNYRSTRADVWRAYVHIWRHSLPLKVIQLSIFVMAFITAQSWLQSAGIFGVSQLIVATTIGLAVVLMFVAYPQLRFKPEERTLRIGSAGISTTIGNRSGDIAWAKIARITPTSEAVYVVGISGNSFTVPTRSFANAPTGANRWTISRARSPASIRAASSPSRTRSMMSCGP